MLVICSWCGRQRINGEWVITLPPPPGAMVSHGCCDDCFKREIESMLEEEENDGK